MMRHEAEALIASLGFEIVHRVGHGAIAEELPEAAGPIDAIFVLGSIQYSDAWAQPTLLERLERSVRFHRHFPQAKVVFLPATWGAFAPEHRGALADLVGDATVLVRDSWSATCINDLLGHRVAQYCPDLAFGYPAATTEAARQLLRDAVDDPARPTMGIIANQRCIEPGVTPLRRPDDYLDALARVRDHAVRSGFNVVGISHMLNTDRDMALMRDLGVVCVPANDATLTRSLIANLAVCVCSRYHGLISCLSHSTPVLALGWHHKYRNLMQDFALADYHLSVADLPRDVSPLVDALIVKRHDLRHAISLSVARAQALVREQTAPLASVLGTPHAR
jgi:polysaccharide pyruvyl transferase WcaK-like protein